MCGKQNEEYDSATLDAFERDLIPANKEADLGDENVNAGATPDPVLPKGYTNKDATVDGLAFATKLLNAAFAAKSGDDMAKILQESVASDDWKTLALNMQRLDALVDSLRLLQPVLAAIGIRKAIASGELTRDGFAKMVKDPLAPQQEQEKPQVFVDMPAALVA